MSTTFEVYTPTKIVPSFNDILALSNKYLAEKLESHGIDGDYIIDVSGRKLYTHDYVLFDKTRPAIWSKNEEYAWFTVNKQPGGCDAYMYNFSDYCGLRLEAWNSEFELNERAKKMESQMRKCLDTGFFWAFRRSAGQPAIIHLSYGLIAAAFAELTEGFIYSSDGAWDCAMFPTTAKHFLKNYFDPHYPVPDHADWAKECIESIRNEESAK